MLKILDKYIIKQYLVTFFFMLGVIMILSMVFDLSDRLGEFIDNQASFTEIIFDYYLNFVLYFGNLFSPLIIFLSVIWFTAKLAQNTEIIPMINSGRNFTRILRPYLIGATILMLLSLVLNHFVLPNANKSRLAFEEQYYRNSHYVNDYHAQFPGDKTIYFDSYYSDEGIANDFVLEQRDENNKMLKLLRAKKAAYNDTTGVWIFTNYHIRTYSSNTINEEITEGKQLDTLIDVALTNMTQRDNIVMTMGFFEVNEFIKSKRAEGSPNVAAYEIEYFQRTSLPFATYVLTVIGLAVSSRKKRGGIGVSIAIGLGLVFVYIFAMQITTVAAVNVGFPTLLAVWLPNMIFAALGLILYRFAPK